MNIEQQFLLPGEDVNSDKYDKDCFPLELYDDQMFQILWRSKGKLQDVLLPVIAHG